MATPTQQAAEQKTRDAVDARPFDRPWETAANGAQYRHFVDDNDEEFIGVICANGRTVKLFQKILSNALQH